MILLSNLKSTKPFVILLHELYLMASTPSPSLPDTLTKEEKEQIQREVKEAIEEARSEIDWDQIKAEMDEALEDIDWDQMKMDMADFHVQIDSMFTDFDLDIDDDLDIDIDVDVDVDSNR